MTTKRSGASATLLNDGRVLVTGGNYELGAELYNPTTGSFTVAGETTGQRLYPRGIRLCSGRVLLVDDGGDFVTVDLYE
jgi:hypothetical protein